MRIVTKTFPSIGKVRILCIDKVITETEAVKFLTKFSGSLPHNQRCGVQCRGPPSRIFDIVMAKSYGSMDSPLHKLIPHPQYCLTHYWKFDNTGILLDCKTQEKLFKCSNTFFWNGTVCRHGTVTPILTLTNPCHFDLMKGKFDIVVYPDQGEWEMNYVLIGTVSGIRWQNLCVTEAKNCMFRKSEADLLQLDSLKS